MLGPFATARRRYIVIHQVSLLAYASYSYSAGGVRCPRRRRRRRQRQRMTEGTAMAPLNGPNKLESSGTFDLNSINQAGASAFERANAVGLTSIIDRVQNFL